MGTTRASRSLAPLILLLTVVLAGCYNPFVYHPNDLEGSDTYTGTGYHTETIFINNRAIHVRTNR